MANERKPVDLGFAEFAAQVVAVNDRGEPIATALTDAGGDFVMQAVPAGTYRVYAEPLDGPVDPRNLAGIWRDAKVTSFGTHFADGAPLRVENGKVYGNLMINNAGAQKRAACGKSGSAKTSNAYSPALLWTPATSATTGGGALVYVGGIQPWNGKASVLMRNAIASGMSISRP